MSRIIKIQSHNENYRFREACSKIISKSKENPEGLAPLKQRLTFKDIQNITRAMLKDTTAHEHNMGVISSIKGKMYCLKLGEVSSSKDFSHFFYSNQYKRRQKFASSMRKGSSLSACPTANTVD